MSQTELAAEFATLFFLGCSATWALLLIISRLVPPDFLQANMRGQKEGAIPVRQLGGLAIIPVLIAIILYTGGEDKTVSNTGLLAFALIIVWITGILDDTYHLPVGTRLIIQAIAAVMAVIALGSEFRLLPEAVPAILENTLAVLFLVWFINVTNFMDGLDLMTVSGLGVPALLAGILLISHSVGGVPLGLAAGISGTLVGFAPYNMPKARLYLGDNGSIPLGLAAGVLSLQLAAAGNILSAFLVFAYYHIDVGITLMRRITSQENIISSHTSHFYQRASRAGLSAIIIAFSVCVLNLVLVGMAAVAMTWSI